MIKKIKKHDYGSKALRMNDIIYVKYRWNEYHNNLKYQ